MVIYVAGRIKGVKDYKKYFAEACKDIKFAGHIPLNPSLLPEGMDEDSYMPICYAMLDAADAIYLLKGWEISEGAKQELFYALKTDKRIMVEGE